MLMTRNQINPIKQNNKLMRSHDLGGQINSISFLNVSAYCLMILIDFSVVLLNGTQLPFLTTISHDT
jgi:hypothetical protein